ncbi:MAG: hypothetical protein R3E84_13420 [Pseudomonadales bacterium]
MAFDAVIVEYVFFSRALRVLDGDIVKLIDTMTCSPGAIVAISNKVRNHNGFPPPHARNRSD